MPMTNKEDREQSFKEH